MKVRIQKQPYFIHISLFFTSRCAANFVFKMSVPQAQKAQKG